MKTDDLLHNWSLLEWRSFKGDGSRGRAGLHLRVRNEGVTDNITEKVTVRAPQEEGHAEERRRESVTFQTSHRSQRARSMSRAPGRFCW